MRRTSSPCGNKGGVVPAAQVLMAVERVPAAQEMFTKVLVKFDEEDANTVPVDDVEAAVAASRLAMSSREGA